MPNHNFGDKLYSSHIENQLLASQADAIFASIGEGAIATDAQGRVSLVNNVALDLLGFNADELIGKWFPVTVVAVGRDGEPVDLINRPITQAFLTGGSISTSSFYRRKDGEIIPVHLTVSPIIINGRPVGAIEVFRDISHEQEIDRMKSEFISIASHQLRTPLSAIKMYSHILHDGLAGELSKRQNNLLENIIKSSDRMNELISTLLDLSKMEAGVMNVSMTKVTVNEVMKKSIQELMPAIKEKKIKFVHKCQDPEIVLQSDPLLLGEIFRNLISNAVKYTPSGGEVSFSCTKKGSKVVFRVSDTGHGIPKRFHDRVFTKFFRGSNITDLDTTGSGLGLYMVKTISDSLGLKLDFKSSEGKGSVFSLTYLPSDTVAASDD